ncbi:PAS domain-containing protein [Devosia sp. XJ19-1]|uniref:PAS domain-containing protein n=1 Tax=Devosia ureilytica TaxID=2952754 RepID=A0A9Q4AMX3_9HYPH|nr:PAS domain-containing protein [Devosia ureilytica]MCP8883027.1 PAS domain-containing protein [Devosia ureilytica]MCP8886605.1 PAS domain-containing protein [Devosia ureilytica]
MKPIDHAAAERRIRDSKLDLSVQALTLSDVRTLDAPLVYVNRAFEKMTGYERSDVIGRNCRFLQGPDTSPEAVEQMRAAIANGVPLLTDVLNYRKNGTSFWNRLSLTPVTNQDGQVTHYIGIQSDITLMRALQERLHSIALGLAAAEKFVLD